MKRNGLLWLSFGDTVTRDYLATLLTTLGISQCAMEGAHKEAKPHSEWQGREGRLGSHSLV